MGGNLASWASSDAGRERYYHEQKSEWVLVVSISLIISFFLLSLLFIIIIININNIIVMIAFRMY